MSPPSFINDERDPLCLIPTAQKFKNDVNYICRSVSFHFPSIFGFQTDLKVRFLPIKGADLFQFRENQIQKTKTKITQRDLKKKKSKGTKNNK